MIRAGDIVEVKGKLHERALNLLIEPYSPYWHEFIVGEEIKDDHIIYEMGPNGCNPGRLSMYDGMKYAVYRVPDRKIAHCAADEASRYGRWRYDYILFAHLFFKALRYWIKNGFRPVPYTEFRDVVNNQLICIELVANCFYNAGYPLVPDGVIPTPAAMKAALRKGLVREVPLK